MEVTSALARREREGSIERREMEVTIRIMLSEFAFWRVVDIDSEVTALAREVLGKHPLRASDAIQLATALLIERRLGKRLDGFVMFDRRLATAARGEGLASTTAFGWSAVECSMPARGAAVTDDAPLLSSS